ncbi:glycosyltransferase [Paracoccus sp. YIM 132242]|uniref:Glycosyltransferase n=1 Tax=Paracoccus lichenicola TaxID=2665644 RepID=A0A6L6HRN1_9RHOB|nr:glycosyltransferase family 2 protein [Paracoccus lichenicola]MTE01099.1 glycosyltransferase [Paracoccus lichenicola]
MTPDISVVLPARDEAGNIAALLHGIAAVLRDRPHEIIVIDDASTDGTRQELAALQPVLPQLRVICHDRSCGQSAAIRSGVLAARGALIATLDADGQNPPENLPALLAPFRQGNPAIGLVQGQRVGRRDRWTRRLASRLANRIRGALLHDGVQDSGCGLKAFPRAVYLALPYFDHIHRFMPAMIAREGLVVVTVPVTHAPRAFGRSKYGNLQRGLVGIVDLMGAAWLIRRRRLPQARELPPAAAAASGIRGAA